MKRKLNWKSQLRIKTTWVSLVYGLILTLMGSSAYSSVIFTNLYIFTGFGSGTFGSTGWPNGTQPECKLIQAPDGQFYGTTAWGGTNGWGSIFKITTNGTLITLYDFADTTDGAEPEAGLTLGPDGKLYGTAVAGSNDTATVFSISTSGNFESVYASAGADDSVGDGTRLTLGKDGSFYGITRYGGGTNQLGNIYKITTNGIYTPLHSFNGYDGESPATELVQANDGRLYGAAVQAGTNGLGTLFAITTNGMFSLLYTFMGDSDGGYPSGLTLGGDGNLYGTTGGVGATNFGTVFRITTNGVFTNLYSFKGAPDGAGPGPLLQGSDDAFYGVTFSGGTNGYGEVFSITTNGAITSLYSFTQNSSGADLVQGVDGSFYGTTEQGGGANADGTVYKLSVPLNPPANQINQIQVTGVDVALGIPSVARATYQLQYRSSLTVGQWSNVSGASAMSIGGSLTLTNFGGYSQPQRFYRFLITP